MRSHLQPHDSKQSASTLSALALFLILSVASGCAAQTLATDTTDKSTGKEEVASSKGFTFYEFMGGSFYSQGHVLELDTTVGYNFTNHFGVDVGIPAYFVGGHGVDVSPIGPQNRQINANGFGDVYADLLVNVVNPTLTYLGSIRGTAPTGDRAVGFSTGRATYDWDNYFAHDFGRLRPFADAGLANTISNTHFFYRPFTTLGEVALLEGGATLKVIPKLELSASLYDDAPIGTQKVFIFGKSGEHEFVGRSSIDRDNGFSFWTTLIPSSIVSLEAGYDHSVRYRLDVFSFGIGINVAAAYRKAKHSL